MEKQITVTADGSHTISIPALHVTYHSLHGAIKESLHVYINAGLLYMSAVRPAKRLSILEMGFGTGLNALLTLQEAIHTGLSVYYQSVEQYPLTIKEVEGLNYASHLEDPSLHATLIALHEADWDTDVSMHPAFTLHKSHVALEGLVCDKFFDIIYYDAFAPAAQPELWTESIFRKLYSLLTPGGVLVTYCSKGDVKRAMQAAGLQVKNIPGPPRKREMLRATRPV